MTTRWNGNGVPPVGSAVLARGENGEDWQSHTVTAIEQSLASARSTWRTKVHVERDGVARRVPLADLRPPKP